MTGDGRSDIGTVVVGAGQAGLATAYHLGRRGQDFVVLEASDRVGTSWRQRWDSLRLFTPAGFDRLPGRAFPGPPDSYPGKEAVADYLEAYAEHFELPVQLGTPVTAVRRGDGHFAVTAGDRTWRARNVVLAPGAHGSPHVPAPARDLDPGIVQLHSRDYRRPGDLPDGPVLVVGAGNSGAEIALDVARDPAARRPVHLAGRDVGVTPPLGRHTFSLLQRLGRPGAYLAQRALRGGADPLGRVRPRDFAAAGVERLPRVTGVRGGLPLLEDGRTVEPATVVWCTGLRPDYRWLHLDVLEDDGRLRHRGGVVAGQPGLYAVGLPYQRSITSHLLGGVGADARFVVDHIVARR